ncbi:MAG: hypothetical protein AAFW75_32470, partial [Cyanobacteria bacterium J06636_16]
LRNTQLVGNQCGVRRAIETGIAFDRPVFYPTLIAHKLGIPEWSSTTYQTEQRSLQDFELSDLAFNPTTGEGVILINWGTIKAGKMSVLLAGSPAKQTAFGEKLQSRLQPQLVLQK